MATIAYLEELLKSLEQEFDRKTQKSSQGDSVPTPHFLGPELHSLQSLFRSGDRMDLSVLRILDENFLALKKKIESLESQIANLQNTRIQGVIVNDGDKPQEIHPAYKSSFVLKV